MAQAKKGDTVKVHYTGKLEDGTVFDSSGEEEPLEFTLGEGKIIAGFEKAVEGMEEGESKSVTLPPDEAYGEFKEEGKVTVERSAMPQDVEPQVGQMYQLTMDGGGVVNVSVVDIADDTVTLDANHPLAGRDLTFDITLEEVAS